ncbi:ANTAR domain-containing protein [Streptomyces sp. NPDC003395]
MDGHADRFPAVLREPHKTSGPVGPSGTPTGVRPPSPSERIKELSPSERIKELEETVAQLRQAVVSHAVIDQAIGVVIAVGRVPAAQAWDVLRETSMGTNVKLRRVAEQVVAWGRTGVLAPEIHTELTARLRASHGRGGGPTRAR